MSETSNTTGCTQNACDDISVSIVIPAKNEARALSDLLPRLRRSVPAAEVIVVDDGSTDNSREVCAACGITSLSHPYSVGNGAAVKSGIRAARGSVIVLMDGDGQHDPDDIPRLLAKRAEGFKMVVGARAIASQASMGRWVANRFYSRFASWMVGQRVEDLTSGFRVADAAHLREFLHLLPNGFSYPTTSTMAFFRSGYPVAYVPIEAQRRVGQSHIRPIRDGVRFLLIMFRICTLYSPLKLFLPISAASFLCGLLLYAYTYFQDGRFTNMSALLFSTSVIIFLIGLISEQITMLMYQTSGRDV